MIQVDLIGFLTGQGRHEFKVQPTYRAGSFVHVAPILPVASNRSGSDGDADGKPLGPHASLHDLFRN